MSTHFAHRPRWLVAGALLAVLVVAAVTVLVINPFSGGQTAADNGTGTSLATVEQRSLSSTTQVSGTLGYADDFDVILSHLAAAAAGSELASAQQAVISAQAQLNEANRALQDLVDGASESERLSAEQAVTQAQAQLDQANRALQDLKDGPSDTDLRSAQQAVTSAEAELQQAQSARAQLDSGSDDAIAAAEDAVSRAQDALAMAKLSLLSAADAYCDTKGHLLSICADLRIPLTDAQVRQLMDSIEEEISASGAAGDDMHAAQAEPSPTPPGTPEPTPEPPPPETPEPEPTPTPEAEPTAPAAESTATPETGSSLVQATTSLISANTSYKNAVADLEAAKKNLEEAKKGPSSADIAAADAAVAAAQLALDQAKAKLDQLKAGPTQDELDDAQSTVNTASAALHAAKAKLAELEQGPTQSQVDAARDNVDVATAALEAAKARLAEGSTQGDQANGTVTALPAVGQVVNQGEVLYRVNGSPVVLLYGSTPAYRDLAAGARGPDVQQLNANLVALGYATAEELDPNSDEFAPGTTQALKKLQAALGVDQTGTLALGQAVFLSSAIRVTSVLATLGASIQPGATVLEATSTTPVVTVELDPARQTQVRQGDTVTITLPNLTTTPGTVSSVGTVAATSGGQGGAGNPTIPVKITLTDPAAAGGLDQAPVLVSITTATVDNALVVPVTALLALAGGGYAVEVVAPDGVHTLVPVTPGIFDDAAGLVQVTGTGLAAGQRVVVPST